MYRYPCPACRSVTVLHGRDCRYSAHERPTIEKAYLDIIAELSRSPTTEDALRRRVHGNWSGLHTDILRLLQRDSRLESDGDRLCLVPPHEIANRIEPTDDPIRTLYEHGSVPGAHDNSVFAMIAYYGSKGLSWEDARRQVIRWLTETGTWARGGFEEPTPEALVDNKRHVFEEGYGWAEKAKAAKRVIDNSRLTDR